MMKNYWARYCIIREADKETYYQLFSAKDNKDAMKKSEFFIKTLLNSNIFFPQKVTLEDIFMIIPDNPRTGMFSWN